MRMENSRLVLSRDLDSASLRLCGPGLRVGDAAPSEWFAAKLVTNAIVDIRYYAGQGPEFLARIHELAHVVHNLPGGILGGGERRKERYGYHTFRWMWETA